MMVVYPGTFDPPHLGHLDIVKRASSLFERVLVAISRTSSKKLLFSEKERLDMFKIMVKDLENVDVEIFDGLLVNFVKRKGAKAILRGVRLFADFEYELLIALNNKRLSGIETIFMMPSQEYMHISSTIVKDIARHGGELKNLVHPFVERKLRERFL